MTGLVACLLAAFVFGAVIFTGAAKGGLINTAFILAVIGFLVSLIIVLERRLHPTRGRKNNHNGYTSGS